MMKSKPAIKRIVRALAQLDRRMRSAASFVLCAAVVIAGGMTLSAQTLTTLHSFDRTDGENPAAALTQGTNGNLYGTTAGGGADFQGTVFEITTGGALTTLYSFCSQTNCTDGLWPYAGLVQAPNGNFYGTTEYGGSNYVGFSNCSLPCGYGTVFQITPAGALTTLHSFCSQASECTDGQFPVAGLTLAGNGDLYGDTSSAPTIFSITTSGTLTTLYSFNIFSYGPRAALVQATNGDLYGTTFSDSVFKITLTGTLTNLYTFPDTADPFDGLVQAANGDFYGTTASGGANGYGTVFKMTPAGTLTTLYSFCSQSRCTDGEEPMAGLVLATNGDFYGTTYGGGANGYGTVFKITPSGTLTTLYSFCSQSGCMDGYYPSAGLVQDTNGDLYGTTSSGGTSSACEGGCGTVFRLSVGLGPFVKTQPAAGQVGAAITILGTNLTGATSVSFDGAAAVFEVVSSSEITTTVPAGASSGKVRVVTPSRTLASNVSFRVLP